MKKLIKFNEFLNEELFGLSSTEKELKKRKLQYIEKLRKETEEDENKELINLFYNKPKKDFNIISFIQHIGGGTEKIKYSDDTKLIEKSKINEREKEQHNNGKKLTYRESQNFDKKLFTTTIDNIKIYLVDAGYVRNNIDTEYKIGGHGYIYPNYIPEDEIWVDDKMNQNDIYVAVVHELVERRQMKEQHRTHPKAHEYATERELAIRKKLEEQ
jgi:hypothetical protein